ncbi:MAG: OmpA family protein [Ignavibacteria bacterium]|nr:OmpA family protein [Ignavibacteria bacterium]
MRIFFTFLAVFISIILNLFAQKFGFSFSLNFNRCEGDFRQFNTFPDTIPFIGSGTNFGLSVGLTTELKIFDKVSFEPILGYSTFSINSKAERKFIPPRKVADGDGKSILFYKATLSNQMSYIFLGFPLKFEFLKNLSLISGITLGYHLAYPEKFHFFETFTTPSLSRPDTTAIFSLSTAGKKNPPLSLTLDIGVAFTPPFHLFDLFKFTVQPSLSFGFIDKTKDFTSDFLSLGLKFNFYPEVRQQKPQLPKELPPPLPPLDLSPPLPQKDTITVVEEDIEILQIDYVGIDNGVKSQQNFTYIKEPILTFLPLLNYIFFSYGESSISKNYKLLTPEEAKTFSLNKVLFDNPIEVYNNILNIVGYRLSRNPQAKVNLVGCNSNIGLETENLSLSKSRALSVFDYLHNVWGIDSNRIAIEARNLPSNPSNIQLPEGNEENQRLEILSSDIDILSPIVWFDTIRRFSPKSIRFYAKIQSEKTKKTRLLEVAAAINGQMFINFQKEITDTLSFDVNLNELLYRPNKENDTLEFIFVTKDEKGKVLQKVQKFIPFTNIIQERANLKERFFVMLFDYNSRELTTAQTHYLSTILPKIQRSKKVKIVGYTDTIGDEEYNLKLSKERAQEVANFLKITNVEILGVGEISPPFDCKTPEGRFYSRIVEIIAEF